MRAARSARVALIAVMLAAVLGACGPDEGDRGGNDFLVSTMAAAIDHREAEGSWPGYLGDIGVEKPEVSVVSFTSAQGVDALCIEMTTPDGTSAVYSQEPGVVVDGGCDTEMLRGEGTEA